MSGAWGREERGECVPGQAVSLWNDKNVLEFVVKVAQPVNILKATKTVRFLKWQISWNVNYNNKNTVLIKLPVCALVPQRGNTCRLQGVSQITPSSEFPGGLR